MTARDLHTPSPFDGGGLRSLSEPLPASLGEAGWGWQTPRLSAGAVTPTQLRLGSFVAKAPYPSPLKGEGSFRGEAPC